MSTTAHPLSPHDATELAKMRAALLPMKGIHRGVSFREPFSRIMESVRPSPSIQYERATIGGVEGLWCRSVQPSSSGRMLYLHGGAFIAGTAWAHRHLASLFVVKTGVSAFLPDYRLAPEHPFPAAVDDVLATWQAMSAEPGPIVVVGDSAGGGLALGLAAELAQRGNQVPCAVAVMSPALDLTGTSPTYQSRADDDFLLTPTLSLECGDLYLAGADPRDPRASPVFGDLTALPPIRIDVGDAEIMLNDSVLFETQARLQGLDVVLHVWSGMPHVFVSRSGHLEAADAALEGITAFLSFWLDNDTDVNADAST